MYPYCSGSRISSSQLHESRPSNNLLWGTLYVNAVGQTCHGLDQFQAMTVTNYTFGFRRFQATTVHKSPF